MPRHRLVRAGERLLNEIRTRRWPSYSRLFLASDRTDWVLGNEAREVGAIARRLGVRVASTEHASGVNDQAVFYGSHFVLLSSLLLRRNRAAIAYFHGRRFTPSEPSFAACFDRLRLVHPRISRIQVSNRAMRDFVLGSGVDPGKVFVIPIGVNLTYFPFRTAEQRRAARKRHGIPEAAVVLGSFQKDGVGWGDGRQPKLIKGPDVFLELVTRLHRDIPELFVLLSGPARGYIRAGLDAIGVPYRHVYPRAYPEVGELYQAIDLYVVCSREEGGPKAVLEAMASGVPLVATRVGQAPDLVHHDRNGWLADVEDVDALVHWSARALRYTPEVEQVLRAARTTAEANAYDRQDDLWRPFFAGFVERA